MYILRIRVPAKSSEIRSKGSTAHRMNSEADFANNGERANAEHTYASYGKKLDETFKKPPFSLCVTPRPLLVSEKVGSERSSPGVRVCYLASTSCVPGTGMRATLGMHTNNCNPVTGLTKSLTKILLLSAEPRCIL